MGKKRWREGKIPELQQARETFGKYRNTKERKEKKYICISYVSSVYDIVEEKRRKKEISHISKSHYNNDDDDELIRFSSLCRSSLRGFVFE
jgi:hypothetical protein